MNLTDLITQTLRAEPQPIAAATIVARFPKGSCHRQPSNGTSAESQVRACCNILVRRRVLSRHGSGRYARYAIAAEKPAPQATPAAEAPHPTPTIQRTVPPDEQRRRAADARRQLHMRQAIESAIQRHLPQFTEIIIRDALQGYARACAATTRE